MNTKKHEISTCVIPAAGIGSRWAPISSYVPKEMLPLNNQPVIEQVITKVLKSGIKKIVIVISPQKEIIKRYISENLGKDKAKIIFVYQKTPKGLADVMLLAKKHIREKAFAMSLPDLPVISNKAVLLQLIEAFDKTQGKYHIVSFDRFPKSRRHLYGECKIRRIEPDSKYFNIIHYCPKDKDLSKSHHENSSLRMSGNYIFKREIFAAAKMVLESARGEVNERAVLEQSLKDGVPSLCVPIIGKTFDTGYPQGYATAVIAFFKKSLLVA